MLWGIAGLQLEHYWGIDCDDGVGTASHVHHQLDGFVSFFARSATSLTLHRRHFRSVGRYRCSGRAQRRYCQVRFLLAC